MEKREYKIQIIILSMLDIAAIIISLLGANYIRNHRFWYENIKIELSTAVLYMILVYVVLAFFKNKKQEFFKRGPWAELIEVFTKMTEYIAILIVSMFCLKIASKISRIAFFLFYIFSIILMFTVRSIYKYILLNIAKKSSGFRKQLELKKFKLFFLCIMHKEEGEENDKPRVVQSKQKEIM